MAVIPIQYCSLSSEGVDDEWLAIGVPTSRDGNCTLNLDARGLRKHQRQPVAISQRAIAVKYALRCLVAPWMCRIGFPGRRLVGYRGHRRLREGCNGTLQPGRSCDII
jgi:hypothetical protein